MAPADSPRSERSAPIRCGSVPSIHRLPAPGGRMVSFESDRRPPNTDPPAGVRNYSNWSICAATPATGIAAKLSGPSALWRKRARAHPPLTGQNGPRGRPTGIASSVPARRDVARYKKRLYYGKLANPSQASRAPPAIELGQPSTHWGIPGPGASGPGSTTGKGSASGRAADLRGNAVPQRMSGPTNLGTPASSRLSDPRPNLGSTLGAGQICLADEMQ